MRKHEWTDALGVQCVLTSTRGKLTLSAKVKEGKPHSHAVNDVSVGWELLRMSQKIGRLKKVLAFIKEKASAPGGPDDLAEALSMICDAAHGAIEAVK